MAAGQKAVAITVHRVPTGNRQESANSAQDRGFHVRRTRLTHLQTGREGLTETDHTGQTPTKDTPRATDREDNTATGHIPIGHIRKGHVRTDNIRIDRTLTDHTLRGTNPTDHIQTGPESHMEKGHTLTGHIPRTVQRDSSQTVQGGRVQTGGHQDLQRVVSTRVDSTKAGTSARGKISASSAMRTRAESAR